MRGNATVGNDSADVGQKQNVGQTFFYSKIRRIVSIEVSEVAVVPNWP